MTNSKLLIERERFKISGKGGIKKITGLPYVFKCVLCLIRYNYTRMGPFISVFTHSDNVHGTLIWTRHWVKHSDVRINEKRQNPYPSRADRLRGNTEACNEVRKELGHWKSRP